MMRAMRQLAVAAIVLTAAMQAGCLQVDTRIQLHEDGSATITERLQFSQRLLDLAPAGGEQDIAAMLDKKAALERMKHMGEGIELVSHKIVAADRGARESVTVYKIGDVANFTYVCPFLPRDRVEEAVKIKLAWHAPMRDGSSWEHIAGWLGVSFRPEWPSLPRLDPDAPKPPGPTPRDLQVFRSMQPIFTDLAKGMVLRMTFESYAPVLRSSFGWRDARQATSKVDLLDFDADRDADRYGFPFMENEEILLDLLRWRLNSATLADHLKDWTGNPTVPVMHGEGTIYFKPSMPLFKRFFEGKTLTHHRTGETPAKFDEIGYKPGPKANGDKDK